jgi:hypothetical protein
VMNVRLLTAATPLRTRRRASTNRSNRTRSPADGRPNGGSS